MIPGSVCTFLMIAGWPLAILAGTLERIISQPDSSRYLSRLEDLGHSSIVKKITSREAGISIFLPGLRMIGQFFWLVGFTGDIDINKELVFIDFILGLILCWLITEPFSWALSCALEEKSVILSSKFIFITFKPALILDPPARLLKEAMSRLIGTSKNLNDSTNEAEADLLRQISDIQREGGIDESSAEMLERVVEFRSTDVSEVMTPRTDIEAIENTDDLEKILDFVKESGRSRIPVYKESLDNIVGILYAKDLLPYVGTTSIILSLEEILREPIVVPETKVVSELLSVFQMAEVHMAIVVDEYGGTAGLVTIEDILEEIVGEIQDEHDPEEDEIQDFIKNDDDSFEVDGRMHIDQLNDLLDLDLPEEDEYDTLGGYIMTMLGRVPEVGEVLKTDNAIFTTKSATSTRVERLKIKLQDKTIKKMEDS